MFLLTYLLSCGGMRYAAKHREQKHLENHILLLSSLDQQMMLLARHQRLIDVMVDTAADVNSDHV